MSIIPLGDGRSRVYSHDGSTVVGWVWPVRDEPGRWYAQRVNQDWWVGCENLEAALLDLRGPREVDK